MGQYRNSDLNLPLDEQRAFIRRDQFPDVIVVSDLNKNIGGLMKIFQKKARIGGFAYPYSSPSLYYKNKNKK